MDFISIVREILDLIGEPRPKEDPIKFIHRPSIRWTDYVEEEPFYDHIHTKNNRKGE